MIKVKSRENRLIQMYEDNASTSRILGANISTSVGRRNPQRRSCVIFGSSGMESVGRMVGMFTREGRIHSESIASMQ